MTQKKVMKIWDESEPLNLNHDWGKWYPVGTSRVKTCRNCGMLITVTKTGSTLGNIHSTCRSG